MRINRSTFFCALVVVVGGFSASAFAGGNVRLDTGQYFKVGSAGGTQSKSGTYRCEVSLPSDEDKTKVYRVQFLAPDWMPFPVEPDQYGESKTSIIKFGKTYSDLTKLTFSKVPQGVYIRNLPAARSITEMNIFMDSEIWVQCNPD